MITAINFLGTDRVYISILESGSKDDTPRRLAEFGLTER